MPQDSVLLEIAPPVTKAVFKTYKSRLLTSFGVAVGYTFLVLGIGSAGILPRKFEFLLEPGPLIVNFLFGGFLSWEGLAIVLTIDIVVYATILFMATTWMQRSRTSSSISR